MASSYDEVKPPTINEDGSLCYMQYVKRGNMIILREALDADDPDHLYNHLVSHGITPERYGIQHPYAAEFGEKTRGELIQEIIELRKEITYRELYGV